MPAWEPRERRVSEYFSNNFYVTTSGHFHTRTLFNTISEIGVDRVMFSADYPYETMEEAAGWFDTSLLSHNDSVKVGRETPGACSRSDHAGHRVVRAPDPSSMPRHREQLKFAGRPSGSYRPATRR